MSDAWMAPNIPGLGGSATGFISNGGNAGLANAYAQQAQNNAYFGNQAHTLAAAQVPQSQLYGGGSFGAQPAYYAGVGAAYGRAIPQSSPAAVAAQSGAPSQRPPAQVPVDSGPFDTGNAGAVPYLSGGGLPFGGGGFSNRGGASPFPASAPPVPYQNSPPPGSFSPSPNYPGGSSTFAGRFGAAPPVNEGLQPAPQGTLPQGIFDGVFGPTTPQAPGLSSASFGDRFGAAPASDPNNSFAGRFGFSHADTPSEYTTSPYTDISGTTHQPGQMPPGFSTLFSADNPGGALPRGGYPQQGSPGIMNQGDEPGGDTLTPGDRGLSAPNPFTSGASPFPFAGGYQGSMRDRIASAVTGPLLSSPQMPPPPLSTPTPTAPQMNNAADMLRAGRGWTIAQPAPPQQSGYAPINQAISDIGGASRPGMFDNTAQPLSSMFSPGTYRGR